MKYVGKDSDQNYYWTLDLRIICIFNKIGELIDIFSFDITKTKKIPTIHPSGDVYFLDYDENGCYLYRIKRIW
jgi:hypothetical protein